jgi:hypothetical protein
MEVAGKYYNFNVHREKNASIYGKNVTIRIIIHSF